LAYERKLKQKLTTEPIFEGELFAGQWIRFEDLAGPGFAQPDCFIIQEAGILLFEAKLTQSPLAWPQMEALYAPLLRWIYQLPVSCVQVCKNLRQDEDSIVQSFDKIFNGATLHWMGD